ncbi:hypothetical protein [Luteimonas aquatica]|uniref:hypothetical protein n=1 Tax=Luteimonas aquatica TaxID=450364 RepID=UPI001F57780E|nr:hypothetical protein [Luteimonas aquatica]
MTQNSALHQKIVAEAGQRYHWNPSDTVVSTDTQLSTDGCTIYRASNTALPDAGVLTYAALPEGQLVGSQDGREASAQILRACGSGQDAEWWAQVVARFIGETNGRVVTDDDKLSIGLIQARGGNYAPPALHKESDVTRLRFHVIRRMTEPALVEALLPPQGPIEVDVRSIKR